MPSNLRMRITSGKARGITLRSPRGDSTRPATDAARQAVFSSLAGAVEGAEVLDLFAGTGAYGLEAVSRGASGVVFVESDARAVECLKANISAVLKAVGGGSARTVRADCFSLKAAQLGGVPDIVFADPPYPLLLKNPGAVFALFGEVCGPCTLVVLEAPGEFESPEGSGFSLVKRLGKRSKGKPSQLLFRKSAADAGREGGK